MNDWPETNESLILRVRDPADSAAWSAFLAIYRPVVYRLARSRGLQDADADDLAQQVFVAIARAVGHWQPATDGPPFRAWLYRIAHNEILKAVTRRKPDAAVGSSTVQEMLNAVPRRDDDVTDVLIQETRREAFRWAAEEIRPEFTATSWAMFWQSTVQQQAVELVAKTHRRSKGAVYLARFRVTKRLKEKLDEVSDIWEQY
ncbi:RNA polymerase sigma factor [Roseimaritima ulvae]|uniref:ECF RNA polymerase sigma factor SigE n=1 Tax=Roseimaritima ulvae TaxID=980254 RepID=A0A5B9QUT5_9BACT|nr:RNA polymerase sigma factor [Roseimaritima ulvae]QEG41712.1 ECF RNA polymerase sigma factor SigE [Roseimaritima ulvae]